MATALSETAFLLKLEGRAGLPVAHAPPMSNLLSDARLSAARPAHRGCGGGSGREELLAKCRWQAGGLERAGAAR